MAQTIGSIDLASLKNLRDDLTQYFWFESSSSATYGAGVHITLVPDTTFMRNPTGQNILINTDGFSIRNGLLPMMTLDNDSLDFNVVDTLSGTYTTTATFTATGAQIGQSSGAHSVIDANGQRFYATDGTTQLANIGYGEGVNATGGTSTAPYYTFGTRGSGTIGNYSCAEGIGNRNSGYASHTEGTYNVASGSASHTEGTQNTNSGSYSHVGGFYNSTSGIISQAGGIGLVSTKAAQTIIGIANIEDTNTGEKTIPLSTYTSADCGKYAFIIGNGTVRHPLSDIDDTSFSRSNALTVDWNGNVEAAGEVHGTLANPTISITASTGTLQSATAYRQGNVVQLLVSVQKTTATASGQDVFKGTINTTALRPKMTTTSGTYYGSYALNATISEAGVITIKNADSRQLNAMTSNGNISFTYLID